MTWFRVSPLDPDDAAALAADLFDLDSWAATAAALHEAIAQARDRLDQDSGDGARGDGGEVAAGFKLAAAALRHLVHDPRLPEPLVPAGWPANMLRLAYDDYEHAYQRLLHNFFKSVV